jgi:UDP-N-acetylmuramate: L-alanyl-gamma-D-glutamyl-meso-diaminopimelate ligase
MGALAGLLRQRGFNVTGSDLHAYPPMSTELERMGIKVVEGYRATNLDHKPGLVVVGNVCRVDHPEAAAARERGLNYASLPRVVHDLFLAEKQSLVIAGTHGKTTTTSLTAYLLHAAGRDPSMLVGGIAADFKSGCRLGQGEHFVIEGDEYDSAYFEKVPKFLSYAPSAAVITSVEYDHVDIYPSFDAYQQAFSQLAEMVKPPGPLAVYAGDAVAVQIARRSSAPVVLYGVDGDPLPDKVDWLGVPCGTNSFELFVDGASTGIWKTSMAGAHNLRNTLAALIMGHRAAEIPMEELSELLPAFKGISRRQEIVGRPRGITVYDDFAHHPTAVKETVVALAQMHAPGRLLAAFEPRSATACRRLHQEQYALAFDAVGLAIIAPPGRDLPADEILDTSLLAEEIEARGISAIAASSIDQVLEKIKKWAKPGDGIALLSNGGFGGLRERVVEELQ